MNGSVVKAIRECNLAKNVATALPEQSFKDVQNYLETLEHFKKLKMLANYNQLMRVSIASLNLQSFSRGQVLCRQHDRGDRFYIILSGEVNVYVEHSLQTMKKLNVICKKINLLQEQENIINAEQIKQLQYQHRLLQSLSEEDYELLQLSEEPMFCKYTASQLLSKLPSILNTPSQMQRFFVKKVNHLKANKTFGEFSLAKLGKRTASILAKSEEVITAWLPYEMYNVIFEEEIKQKERLAIHVQQFFPAIGDTLAIQIAYFFQEKALLRNQVVYREGDTQNEVFFLDEGNITLTKRIQDEQSSPYQCDSKQLDINQSTRERQASTCKRKVDETTVVILQQNQFFGFEQSNHFHYFSALCSAAETKVYKLSTIQLSQISDYSFHAILNKKSIESIKRYSQRIEQINQTQYNLNQQISQQIKQSFILRRNPSTDYQLEDFRGAQQSQLDLLRSQINPEIIKQYHKKSKSIMSISNSNSNSTTSAQLSTSPQIHQANESKSDRFNEIKSNNSMSQSHLINLKTVDIDLRDSKLSNREVQNQTITSNLQNNQNVSKLTQQPSNPNTQRDEDAPKAEIIEYAESFSQSKKRIQLGRAKPTKKDSLPIFSKMSHIAKLQKKLSFSTKYFENNGDGSLSPSKSQMQSLPELLDGINFNQLQELQEQDSFSNRHIPSLKCISDSQPFFLTSTNPTSPTSLATSSNHFKLLHSPETFKYTNSPDYLKSSPDLFKYQNYPMNHKNSPTNQNHPTNNKIKLVQISDQLSTSCEKNKTKEGINQRQQLLQYCSDNSKQIQDNEDNDDTSCTQKSLNQYGYQQNKEYEMMVSEALRQNQSDQKGKIVSQEINTTNFSNQALQSLDTQDSSNNTSGINLIRSEKQAHPLSLSLQNSTPKTQSSSNCTSTPKLLTKRILLPQKYIQNNLQQIQIGNPLQLDIKTISPDNKTSGYALINSDLFQQQQNQYFNMMPSQAVRVNNNQSTDANEGFIRNKSLSATQGTTPFKRSQNLIRQSSLKNEDGVCVNQNINNNINNNEQEENAQMQAMMLKQVSKLCDDLDDNTNTIGLRVVSPMKSIQEEEERIKEDLSFYSEHNQLTTNHSKSYLQRLYTQEEEEEQQQEQKEEVDGKDMTPQKNQHSQNTFLSRRQNKFYSLKLIKTQLNQKINETDIASNSQLQQSLYFFSSQSSGNGKKNEQLNRINGNKNNSSDKKHTLNQSPILISSVVMSPQLNPKNQIKQTQTISSPTSNINRQREETAQKLINLNKVETSRKYYSTSYSNDSLKLSNQLISSDSHQYQFPIIFDQISSTKLSPNTSQKKQISNNDQQDAQNIGQTLNDFRSRASNSEFSLNSNNQLFQNNQICSAVSLTEMDNTYNSNKQMKVTLFSPTQKVSPSSKKTQKPILSGNGFIEADEAYFGNSKKEENQFKMMEQSSTGQLLKKQKGYKETLRSYYNLQKQLSKKRSLSNRTNKILKSDSSICLQQSQQMLLPLQITSCITSKQVQMISTSRSPQTRLQFPLPSPHTNHQSLSLDSFNQQQQQQQSLSIFQTPLTNLHKFKISKDHSTNIIINNNNNNNQQSSKFTESKICLNINKLKFAKEEIVGQKQKVFLL